jgi:hypothetical protein
MRRALGSKGYIIRRATPGLGTLGRFQSNGQPASGVKVGDPTTPTPGKDSAVAATSSTPAGTGVAGNVDPSLTAFSSELHPFQIGFNMGVLRSELKTIQMKMEDDKEFIKTQFASNRDTARSNHTVVTQMLTENRTSLLQELNQIQETIAARVEAIQEQIKKSEDLLREAARQNHDAAQKHLDDRLENIKDTVKAGILVLGALLMWIIVLLSSGHHPHAQAVKAQQLAPHPQLQSGTIAVAPVAPSSSDNSGDSNGGKRSKVLGLF